MISIFHGDDEVKIHDVLMCRMRAAKQVGIPVHRIEGKKLTITDLETVIGTDELFATQKLVIIDRFLTIPKSKKKEALATWIESQSRSMDIICVETSVLTATQLKVFSHAQAQVYKLPALLFAWLENIGLVDPGKSVLVFHQVLQSQDAYACFSMLVRQFRLLLTARSGGVIAGPSFVQAKISKQAKAFSVEQLLATHERLLAIDIKEKTSGSYLDLIGEIDLFLLGA